MSTILDMISPKPNQIHLTIVPCQIPECDEHYAFTHLGWHSMGLSNRYTQILLYYGWREMKHSDGYPPLLICPSCAEKVDKSLLVKYKKRK